VWGLMRGADGVWRSEVLFDTRFRVSSFGVDERGEIYLVDHTGAIYMLVQK